jgi:hypothetical protein
MLNWPLDMGKDKVRLRSGSRTRAGVQCGWDRETPGQVR